jgi:hypothetical protein
VDFKGPEPVVHGRIADGGGPKSLLKVRMCWSAACCSNDRRAV